MAPAGSRTTVWPFLLITILIGLLLAVARFHTQLVSALHDIAPESEHRPALRENRPIKEQEYHYELPQISTMFRERPILEDLSSAGDHAWKKAALTSKGGFLWVESNETTQTPYGISMFHGLHCLQMLRSIVRSSPVMQDVVESESHGKISNSRADYPGMDALHIGHCIGYIAQHLMCAADSTIELPWTTLDDQGQISDSGVDGEGYQHQCRDSTFLWETATNSEQTAIKPWRWQQGDTIESVFGASRKPGKR